MNPSEMSALEKLDALRIMLDNLSNANGIEKCGYIVFAADMVNKLKEDVLIMEDKLKNYQKGPIVKMVGTNDENETLSPE